MKQYLQMLDYVLTKGKPKADRTGTGTLTVFDYTMRFNMDDGFPLVTTKKMFTKGIIYELLWFLRGDDNIKFLKDNGVTIWNEWADEEGFVGPIYGYQWRKWETVVSNIDQIKQLIANLKSNPDSRRHLVSAWNVSQIHFMALPPCHFAFQCQVMDGVLNLKVFLRSLDIFLGAPFDIASYAFLLHLLARVTDLIPGVLVVTATDVHLYKNHLDQARLQLTREPYPLPKLFLNLDLTDIDAVKYEDFTIDGYKFHPAIAAPIAV